MRTIRVLRYASTSAVQIACLLALQPCANGQEAQAAPHENAQPPGAAPFRDDINDRLRRMEEANNKLLRQFDRILKQNDDLSRANHELSRENKTLSTKFTDMSRKLDDLEKKQKEAKEKKEKEDQEKKNKEEKDKSEKQGGGSQDKGGSEFEEAGRRSGDAESGGHARGGGLDRGRNAQLVGNRNLGKLPLTVRYNYEHEGLQFTTDDDELSLKIRVMLQADWRQYQQANSDPVSSGFFLPRARFYFTGHITRPIEYNISFQRSYNTLNLLNAFVNFNYDQRVQFRFGRFKTPFTYEFFKLHVWQLMAPERSLFTDNFQGGRQIGFMGTGDLLDRRLEYAAGIFNGPRRSFTDYNSSKDFMALLNFTPFENQENSPLRGLNFGGSVDYGNQTNPLTPVALRTSSNPSEETLDGNTAVNNAAVPFLIFNSNAREVGLRALWELHTAYYYKGLSLIGAWDSGFDSYALSKSASSSGFSGSALSSSAGPTGRPVRIPINGWFAQAGYLLTGETLIDRTVIDPLRPFDLRRGRVGPGAWEITGRYSALALGSQVFTGGFADPNLWTNRVQMVDVGLNWYLNRWMKIYFDWEHAMFAEPVLYKPGPNLQRTSDLFWLRMQIYF